LKHESKYHHSAVLSLQNNSCSEDASV